MLNLRKQLRPDGIGQCQVCPEQAPLRCVSLEASSPVWCWRLATVACRTRENAHEISRKACEMDPELKPGRLCLRSTVKFVPSTETRSANERHKPRRNTGTQGWLCPWCVDGIRCRWKHNKRWSWKKSLKYRPWLQTLEELSDLL